MVPIPELWLPILVTTVLVFAASNVVWMVLPHHRSDMRRPARTSRRRNSGSSDSTFKIPATRPGSLSASRSPPWPTVSMTALLA